MPRDPKYHASALAEFAEFAASGKESWETFNHEFARLYPGSATNITVFDRKSLVPILVATADLDPELERDYLCHYGAINPWNDFWPKAAVGKPYASAKTQPSSLFSSSEFYNEWLMKTGTIDCVGMKLLTSDREIISFSTMLPRTALEANEAHALDLFDRIASSLIKGVESSSLAARQSARNIGAAAIVDRSPDLALVIDHSHKVIAANDQAEDALRAETLISMRMGRVSFCDGETASWLKTVSTELLLGRPVSENKRLCRFNGRYLHISLSRLPYEGVGVIPSRMAHPFLLLIVISELSAAGPPVQADSIARLFGLSHAEASICLALRDGLTINEIADLRGLSRETVRHHLKSIFRKSGTGRQAELVALLQRLR